MTDEPKVFLSRSDYDQILGYYDAELAGRDALLASITSAAAAALGWIDEIYPPDIFDGSSGDPGAVRIVAIRENLRRALQEPQP